MSNLPAHPPLIAATDTAASASPRFDGIERLYGAGALAILARMHCCVVGLGGVGSWAAEALARSGVGAITLVDGDEVCTSNVNRQSHALDGTIGQAKVDVLAARLRAINPACVVTTIARFVTPDTVPTLFDATAYDYVFDACDALQVKIDLVAFLRRRKIPVITCGSAGGRVDPLRIVVRDLAKTEQDVLLAKVRRGLRDDYGWTRNPDRYFGVLAVYSMEKPRYVQADGAVACVKPADAEAAFRIECGGGLGSAMHVTSTFAMVAVAKMLERMIDRARGIRPR